jgi:hypothetical protein
MPTHVATQIMCIMTISLNITNMLFIYRVFRAFRWQRMCLISFNNKSCLTYLFSRTFLDNFAELNFKQKIIKKRIKQEQRKTRYSIYCMCKWLFVMTVRLNIINTLFIPGLQGVRMAEDAHDFLLQEEVPHISLQSYILGQLRRPSKF